MLPMLLLVPALVAPLQPGAIRPIWVSVLPSQPGRVYGLGVAPIAGSDAAAVRQASDNGRADVISRLRANVKADTRITTTSQESRSTGAAATGSRTQDTRVGTEVQAQATDLPGLVVEETYLDRSGSTGYALAYLDMDLAQRELRARLDAQKADLAADRGEQGPRAKLIAVQALKKAHAELLRLDDLAGLLGGGGGDPQLRADVLESKFGVERKLVAARSALTFGLAPSTGVDLDEDVQNIVRTAVVKEGMRWPDQPGEKPLFTIAVRVKGGHSGVQVGRRAWWEYARSADFIVARGSLTLTLVDSSGRQYESMLINAKGVGVDTIQADDLLLADYKAKLGSAVAAWLADMAKW
jgi:hypothetical protein